MASISHRRAFRPVGLGGAILLCLALSSGSVGAAMGEPLPCLRGVNLSGAEYGDRTGRHSINYTYPSEATVRYFAEKGMSVIRLPFRWERLQPVPNGPLDGDELKRLTDAVDLIRRHDMAVILDPHNFGYYDKTRLGASGPDAAFANFWARLAAVFSDREAVLFGLMNEPHDIPARDWLKTANLAIRAIRATGAGNLVLVPGTVFSGVGTWQTDVLGGANGEVMLGIRDPVDNYAFEVHQYFDADSSGTHATCEGAAATVKAIAAMTEWLQRHDKRGFLGEFGVSSDRPCVTALSEALGEMSRHPEVWLGWSYWAAGDWWPPDEPFNVQPRTTPQRPQMTALADANRGTRPPLGLCLAPLKGKKS